MIDLIAAIGVLRMDFDDGLSKVFDSRGPVYEQYQDFQANFNAGEGDLLVVFSGQDFTAPQVYDTLREFVFEVQFEPGLGALISPFSFDLSATPDIDEIDQLWRENSGFRRFLSKDRQVFMVSLVAENWAVVNTVPLHERVRVLADRFSAPAALSVQVTGYPVLRDNVVVALFDDFVLHILLGVIIGTFISTIALRSFTLAAAAAITSGTALFWMLGLFGWVGIAINVVTISLPVLILVLSFAASIHLTFELRRRFSEGDPHPVRSAARRIAPAAVLTTLTTAAAFSSLTLSPSALISNMGLAGALATLISLLAVFAAQPLLLASLSHWRGLGHIFAGKRGETSAIWHLRALPNLAAKRPVTLSILSTITLLIAVAVYLQVEPVYSLYDNVPRDGEAFLALELVEHQLAPIGSLSYPVNMSLETPGAIETLREAAALLRRSADPLEVTSLADFVRQGATDIANLPAQLHGRLVSHDAKTPLLIVLAPNDGAVAIRNLVAQIDAQMRADPGFRDGLIGNPTGLLAASSFLSRDMLLDLNRCFLVAVIVSGLVVMVWLRNPVLGLVALVPNVLPVALVGAWLTLSGSGLEFSSGIALTIAFGLAIDDTIHMLNRLRLNTENGAPISAEGIRRAVREVAPALVITSGVLSLGLLGTQIGQLSSVAYFGRLSIAAFVLALVADLLILPAVLLVAERLLPAKLLRIRT